MKVDEGYLVWWTTQEDTGAIGDDLPVGVPAYMQEQWASRLGRNGRGRLWSAFEVGDLPLVDNAICRWASGAAGMVIRLEDAVWLRALPGLLTTLGYERASYEAPLGPVAAGVRSCPGCLGEGNGFHCAVCSGTGALPGEGFGFLGAPPAPLPDPPGRDMARATCPDCNEGWVRDGKGVDTACLGCAGTGWI